MTRRNGLLLAAAAALAVAAPAMASDKQDFVACDGLNHPGKKPDGMGLGASTSWKYSGTSGMLDACTRALASPRLLPGQTLRRAHLLRARAAAHLRAGETDRALEDLAALEQAAAPIAGDRFYQRSMGVSVQLLRALALAAAGRLEEALPIARAAAAARPYSLQVQRVAATVLQAARRKNPAEPSPWLAAARFDPAAFKTAVMKEVDSGHPAGAAAIPVTVTWPTARFGTPEFSRESGGPDALVEPVILALDIAFARAATGDVAGARAGIADIREKLDALRPVAASKSPLIGGTSFADIELYAKAASRQVEARILVSEGRPRDAVPLLLEGPLPREAATLELLTALKAALPASDAGLVPDPASLEKKVADAQLRAIRAAADTALLAAETPRAVVDYEKARPNILGFLIGGALTMGASMLSGVERTDGFRTTDHDDGTRTVEFIGNTPSATLVQEMTLLRAAEVARESGKAGFVIVARKDYERRMTTTQYGMEISSTPAGYKTELTIRCVDAGVEPERALDAVTLIDALGPFYYEAKPAARS